MTVNELIKHLQNLSFNGHGDKMVTISDWYEECQYPIPLTPQDISIHNVNYLYKEKEINNRNIVVLGHFHH